MVTHTCTCKDTLYVCVHVHVYMWTNICLACSKACVSRLYVIDTCVSMSGYVIHSCPCLWVDRDNICPCEDTQVSPHSVDAKMFVPIVKLYASPISKNTQTPTFVDTFMCVNMAPSKGRSIGTKKTTQPKFGHKNSYVRL